MPNHDAEAKIHRLLQARADALRSRNAEAVLSHYASEAVIFELAPPLKLDSAADGDEVAGLRDWLASFRTALTYEYGELSIQAEGSLALCVALVRMSGSKHSGEEMDLWFRSTLGLRRLEAGWKIVHEHNSVPFYMDGSLRAAVDLRP